MKKVFLSLAVVVIATLSVNAQQVQFGVKGGLNIASLNGSGSGGLSSIVGVHFGGLASIKVSDLFHVQPELVFSTQGAKGANGKLNINYLNIPVLAKYTITNGLDIEAGPQFGFLLSAEQNLNNGNSSNISSSVKSVDLALALGASYDITKSIGVDVRYNIGLTDIHSPSNSNNTLHNAVVQIGVYYLFDSK
jgi:hypothetical protein